jgi:hypothetical protein
MKMENRRMLLGKMGGLLGLAGVASAETAPSAKADKTPANRAGLIFVQQDTVLSFPPTGDGVRVGTATGRINATTITNFQFLPVPPPVFQADDLVMLSDLDGDQVVFRAQVTGRFLAPPLSVPNNPNGNLFSVGGPFTGTYEAIQASGKYGYLIGRKFPCKGLGSNPAKGGFLGTVLVEVYSDRFED